MKSVVTTLVLVGGLSIALAQGNALSRRYVDDERLNYVMSGTNNGRPFEVRLHAVVTRDAKGQFVEEFSWLDLRWNGQAEPLTASSRDFRQLVTLAGGAPFTFPNLSVVQPGLIGPVTDLLTFYADLFLAIHVAKVSTVGDHFYWPHPAPSSWADGKVVVIGENAIDFDITLTGLTERAATLLVKHVPPKDPSIQIPAEWMRAPVAGTPNNWIEVSRANGRYVASMGKETFDVQLVIDRDSGVIIAASMDNVVDAVGRDCADRALTECGESRPNGHVRRIELRLQVAPTAAR